ncbi:MAG TPA: T9SS type A sorting domain-containing protein, partial [Bacteroidia bacterium]|nr:T9SS type A sorting domain-containing protein [Bacteroidia bacterium]
STSESCVTCCDATALVTPSGGTPGYTFSWSCVPAQYSDTAKQLCAGTYTVCIKDNNGCSVCETVAVAFHTGLAPDPSEIKLQVFPNPANDVLNISFFAGSGQTAKISILSILGTEVYSESVLASGNFHKTIPVQDLPNGLYFIQISAGHTQHTVRFVKN